MVLVRPVCPTVGNVQKRRFSTVLDANSALVIAPLVSMQRAAMSNQTRKRKKLVAPRGSTRERGDVVEQIVAEVHDVAGVRVERNVFLPAQDGSGRTREIDVLLSSQVAGYPVRVAIECKNERKPIGIDEIDEFIGKLNDVDIPLQHGIFVSVSRYTKDALLRAQKVGMKATILRDMTSSLSELAREAFQSAIYLLLTVTNIEVHSDVAVAASPADILFFRNNEGHVCGGVPDLVWREWRSCNIPAELGTHQVDLRLPDGWLQVIEGRVANVHGIKVDVQITAHVVSIPGRVTHRVLLNALNQRIEKRQTEAKFDIAPGTYPVKGFLNEEDLERFLTGGSGMKISVGRFRLPRIRWCSLYWPPSESSMRKLIILMHQAFREGKTLDLASMDLAEIEGTDMREIWEPIWREHPAVKEPPNSGSI